MVLYTRVSESTEQGEQPGVRLKLRSKTCKGSEVEGIPDKGKKQRHKNAEQWEGQEEGGICGRLHGQLLMSRMKLGVVKKRSYLTWAHFIVCK